MTLYRYLPVWVRLPAGPAVYHCFEVIGQGFTVQSKDYFYTKLTIDEEQARIAQAERQFLELLHEQAPEQRFRLSPTIHEAVAAFDAEFS